jgi:hypothetical protein
VTAQQALALLAGTHRVIEVEADENVAEVIAVLVCHALVAQRDVQHEIAAAAIHQACLHVAT